MSLLNKNIFDEYELDNDVKELLQKSANSFAGAIPLFGSAIQEFVIYPLMNEKSKILSDAINKDIDNLNYKYENGLISDRELTRNISHILLHDEIPTDLKLKYIPTVINKHITQIHNNNVYINNLIKNVKNMDLENKKVLIDFKSSLTSECIKLVHIEDEICKNKKISNYNKKNINDILDNMGKITNNKQNIKILFDETNNISLNLSNLNNDIVKLWSNIDISGFESDEMINSYKNIIDNNQHNTKILKKYAVLLKNRKIKILNERKSIDDIFNNSEKLLKDSIPIIHLFAGNKSARKICGLASATISIGRNISTLAGLGSLTLCTNPFTACVGIAGGIASIINCLDKQDDGSIGEALNQIYEQLNTIRKEMHKRFDNLDEKIYKIYNISMYNFSKIINNQQFIAENINNISCKLDKMDNIINEQFKNLSNKIDEIYKSLIDYKKQKSLNTLFSQLYIYINEEFPNTDLYVDRVNSLDAYINITSIFEGNKKLPSNIYPFNQLDYDFSINTLLKLLNINKKIPNQTIYIVSALSLLYLTIKQYPSIKSAPLSRITEIDINRLKKIKSVGVDIINIRNNLNTKINFKSLCDQYNTLINKYKNEHTTFINNYNHKLCQNLNNYNQYSKSNIYDNVYDIELFKKPFDVNPSPKHTNWYKGSQMCPPVNGASYQPSYKDVMQDNITKQKQNYINNRRTKSKNFKTATVGVTTEMNLNIDEIDLPYFIFPTSSEDYLLPVPDWMIFYIPNNIKELCVTNLGHLRFEYSYNNGGSFILYLFVIHNNSKVKFKEIKLNFHYYLFEECHERVWWYWVGGHFCAIANVGMICRTTGCNLINIKTPCPIPNIKYHEGCMQHIHKNMSRVAEIGSKLYYVNTQDYNIGNINNIIDVQKNKRIKEFDVSFKNWVFNNSTIKELNQIGKIILGFMNITMRDIIKDKHNFEIIKNTILDENKILNNNLDVNLDILVNLYEKYKNYNNNQILEFTVNILNYFIDYYENFSVKFNRWYRPSESSELMDDILKESAISLGNILNIAIKNNDQDVIGEINNLKDNIRNMAEKVDDDIKSYTLESLKMLCDPENNNKVFICDEK